MEPEFHSATIVSVQKLPSKFLASGKIKTLTIIYVLDFSFFKFTLKPLEDLVSIPMEQYFFQNQEAFLLLLKDEERISEGAILWYVNKDAIRDGVARKFEYTKEKEEEKLIYDGI